MRNGEDEEMMKGKRKRESADVYSKHVLKVFLHKKKKKRYWTKNSGPCNKHSLPKRKRLWPEKKFII